VDSRGRTTIIINPEAQESEFYDAVAYFDEQIDGLGTEFARDCRLHDSARLLAE